MAAAGHPIRLFGGSSPPASCGLVDQPLETDPIAMSLDPTFLFLSFITGGIGFVLLVYGKKQQRLPQLVAGVVFLVYPYFLSTPVAVVGVGIALGLALWWVIKLGW